MSTVMPPPSPNTTPQPDRAFSAKDAKAEAKASKARAKAMRPWYRKKRYLFTIALIVIIGVVVATNGSKDTPTSDPTATVAGVDNGAGSANASADVTSPVLGEPDAIGFRTVTMSV